jgi:cephalosporin hydroxylase
MLQAYGRLKTGKVISIDLDTETPRALLTQADPDFEQTITLVAGDVCDPELPSVVARHVQSGAFCLVVEDSAHVYDTTFAALRGFARFVRPGGFFIVEDGYVDIDDRRPPGDIPRGVLPAVRDWLKTREGRRFDVDQDMEMYGISSHPHGFLRRRR